VYCGQWNKNGKAECKNKNCTRGAGPREFAIRPQLEEVQGDTDFQNRVVSRATCYASLIYQHATNRQAMESRLLRVEHQIRRGLSQAPTGVTANQTHAELLASGSRSYTSASGITIKDQDIGWAIIRVALPNQRLQYYVVIRGSRGTFKPGHKYNEMGAGWADEIVEQNPANDAYPITYAQNKRFDHPKVPKHNSYLNVDWHGDFDNAQVVCPYLDHRCKVHRGFLSIYESMENELHQVIDALPATAHVIVCGHSLGAGVATLCATDLRFAGRTPICVALSSPRVGNYFFAREFNTYFKNTVSQIDGESVSHTYNITNKNDPVWKGGKYAFKNAPDFWERAPESNTVVQGLKFKAKFEDKTQIYYHCGKIYVVGKRFSFITAHKYDRLLNEVVGPGTLHSLNFAHTK
jgi:hypothetical protein